MKLSDFDFDLPEELIAMHPAKERDQSKLLICGKKNNLITKFSNIIDEIRSGDLLIFNDSKVVNAQLELIKGDKKIHANLNREIGKNIWNGYAKPGKKLKVGDEFCFGANRIIIDQKEDNGLIHFKFILENNISIFEFLNKYGQVPLPQYIKRNKQILEDKERYQSIFAQHPGSVAAPTASLHFTTELIDKIKAKGAQIERVTLHIGAGTFLPVKTQNIEDHQMHHEYVTISEDVAARINTAKNEGRRVIVIGTTAMRAVESFAYDGKLSSGTKDTNIFIRPGYKFNIADMMVTNFHFPKSTLFMLVCAFSGYKEMREIYSYAIENKMRFFSYGDAMLINLKKDTI